MNHYSDVIMGAVASQVTSLTIVYSTFYSDADQRKHQSSVSLAFVQGIHREPVNFPHKWPVTRKMFPFDDVIMWYVHAVTSRHVTMQEVLGLQILHAFCRLKTQPHQLTNIETLGVISDTADNLPQDCENSGPSALELPQSCVRPSIYVMAYVKKYAGGLIFCCNTMVYDLYRTSIVMAKHGGSCVHFTGISTCGRTSRETVSHPQSPTVTNSIQNSFTALLSRYCDK